MHKVKLRFFFVRLCCVVLLMLVFCFVERASFTLWHCNNLPHLAAIFHKYFFFVFVLRTLSLNGNDLYRGSNISCYFKWRVFFIITHLRYITFKSFLGNWRGIFYEFIRTFEFKVMFSSQFFFLQMTYKFAFSLTSLERRKLDKTCLSKSCFVFGLWILGKWQAIYV